MRFSALSNSLQANTKTVLWLTWILRLLLGTVFLYSGFTKAVDPWGSQYKIADYFAAWNLNMSDGIYLTMGCVLSGFEFILGLLLVTGAIRRLSALLTLLFTGAMTLLTFYIMIADPVSDCGCFGEAIILSNSATFWKNVILFLLAVLLYLLNPRVRPLIHHHFQWLLIVFSIAYVLAIQLIGYHVQPLIDFRPYKVGSNLKTLIDGTGESDRYTFIYEKDSDVKAFSLDSLPDDTWTFIERQSDNEISNKSGIAIFDGEEDVTNEAISGRGREFILTVTEPSEHKLSRSEMANRLKTYADSTGATMIAIVALPPDSLDSWIDYTGAEYDVYTAEDTDLKMLVRGEAGLVMLEDGIIRWKYNLSSISPSFPTDNSEVETMHAIETNGLLTRITVIWLTLLFFTYILSRFYRNWDNHRTHLHDAKRQESQDKPASGAPLSEKSQEPAEKLAH